MIHPLQDNIIITPRIEHTSEGGILIPETAREKGTKRGIVCAVGPGKRHDNGQVYRPNLNEGDRVLYYVEGATEIEDAGKKFDIVEEPFIMGRIE